MRTILVSAGESDRLKVWDGRKYRACRTKATWKGHNASHDRRRSVANPICCYYNWLHLLAGEESGLKNRRRGVQGVMGFWRRIKTEFWKNIPYGVLSELTRQPSQLIASTRPNRGSISRSNSTHTPSGSPRLSCKPLENRQCCRVRERDKLCERHRYRRQRACNWKSYPMYPGIAD